jgi:hypothetical protein
MSTPIPPRPCSSPELAALVRRMRHWRKTAELYSWATRTPHIVVGDEASGRIDVLPVDERDPRWQEFRERIAAAQERQSR